MVSQLTPLISIITVTYKDIEGVRGTLHSLKPIWQDSDGRVEVIVQDGLTGPAFDSIINEFGAWADIQCGSDRGIYDGMNLGLARSRGSYVWFLNGGDLCSFKNWDSLYKVLSSAQGRMVFGAYDLDVGKRLVHRKPRPMWYLHHGLPTSHQAIFYPGGPVRSAKYDLNFSVVGDYALTAALYASGIKCIRAQETFAVFVAGGMSQQHSSRIAKEASLVQHRILRTPLLLRLLSETVHRATRKWRSIQTRSITS